MHNILNEKGHAMELDLPETDYVLVFAPVDDRTETVDLKTYFSPRYYFANPVSRSEEAQQEFAGIDEVDLVSLINLELDIPESDSEMNSLYQEPTILEIMLSDLTARLSPRWRANKLDGVRPERDLRSRFMKKK